MSDLELSGIFLCVAVALGLTSGGFSYFADKTDDPSTSRRIERSLMTACVFVLSLALAAFVKHLIVV
ncbi:MAG: hypothetical protein ACYTDT_13515 [Planctomycetota bacterium]